MATSKRLRYEVLKRDDYTCRYCGRSAPDVKLQVDHIIPTALGGDDHPANLVTACSDCNAGKGSTGPTEGTVAPPTLDSHRWTKAVEEAAADRRRHRSEIKPAREVFERLWPWSTRPDDWKPSLDKFIRMGLTADDVEHFLERAVDRCEYFDHTWNYFCKVCWSEVKTIRARAAAVLAEEGEEPHQHVEEPQRQAIALGPVVAEAEEESTPVVVEEPPVYREPQYDLALPPWYDESFAEDALCIECDERPPMAEGMHPGMCFECCTNLYEGIA